MQWLMPGRFLFVYIICFVLCFFVIADLALEIEIAMHIICIDMT